MSLVPVIIFGPILLWFCVLIVAVCKAAKEPETPVFECERLTCLPLTETERRELDVEMDSITREAACHR